MGEKDSFTRGKSGGWVGGGEAQGSREAMRVGKAQASEPGRSASPNTGVTLKESFKLHFLTCQVRQISCLDKQIDQAPAIQQTWL